MAGTLIFYKGLPSSGKSTAAREAKEKDPTITVVTKDQIRQELTKDWNYDVEKEVLRTRDFRIGIALNKGGTAISADCNLAPKHEARLRDLAHKYKAQFVVDDHFLQVPVEECLRRDAAREPQDRVGAQVIEEMAQKYGLMPKAVLEPVEASPESSLDLTPAVICDIDGTLAISKGHRHPYDFEACLGDDLNEPVAQLIRLYADTLTAEIVYVSGREERYRGLTTDWLKTMECPQGKLYMRQTGDKRKDVVIKREIYEASIQGKYHVLFCLDDRDQTVLGWRNLHMPCFQVASGNF